MTTSRALQLVCLLAAPFLIQTSAQSILPSPPPVNVIQPPAPAVTPVCSSGRAGTLSVAGRGTAEATADVAQVSLSISTDNATADGARNEAAGRTSAVISAIRQINGVSPDNVTTASISITPDTLYNSTDGTSTTVGYTFTQDLTVSLSNLTGDLLSEVLDTAVKSGGNNLTVSSVDFSLSPGLSYNKTIEARQQAVADAKATAAQYAASFGVSLGALLMVVDESYSSTPVQTFTTPSAPMSANLATSTMSASSTGGTPVSVGQQQVQAAISVVYTICDAAH